jgi:ring-1,2-phenylacetyl-CoA epoxidase subunit PaaA
MTGMAADQDLEALTLERIQRGELVEETDDMPAEYRDNLIHLMLMEADSEIAGAFGYVPWIMKAPTPAEMLAVASITRDEVRHGRVVYKLLENLGVDVSERVKQFDFTLRVGESDYLGQARAGQDQRVNIFYYPIDSWADFVLFNVLMDRGAGHQLEDVLKCSYGPWRRVMEGIMKEETMHIAHGDTWLRRLGRDPATHDELQEGLERWWPRIMNVFGRPKTRRNALYRKWGLKLRDNDEVRQAFVDEVSLVIRDANLTVPTWTPDWNVVPEEGQAAG